MAFRVALLAALFAIASALPPVTTATQSTTTTTSSTQATTSTIDILATLDVSVGDCHSSYLTAIVGIAPANACPIINNFNWCLVQAVGESVRFGLSPAQADTFLSVLNNAFSAATDLIAGSSCNIPLRYDDLFAPVEYDYATSTGTFRSFDSNDQPLLSRYDSSSFRIVDLVEQLQVEETFSPQFATTLQSLVATFSSATLTSDSATSVALAQTVVTLVDTVISSLNTSITSVAGVSGQVDQSSNIAKSLIAIRKQVDNEILNLDSLRVVGTDAVFDLAATITTYTTQDAIDRVTYGSNDANYLNSVTSNIAAAISSFTSNQDTVQATWTTNINNLVNNANNQINGNISSQTSTEVSRATYAANTIAATASFVQVQVLSGSTDFTPCSGTQNGTIYYSQSSNSTGFYYCNSTLWTPFLMYQGPFIQSLILDYTRAIRLINLLKYPNWQLCHSSAVNGWSSTTFRNACSARGPTVTVARDASQGRIFGGYNAASWLNSSPGGQTLTNGNTNFIFRWHNGNFDYFPWNGGSYYTYETTSYGPCFGNSPAYSDLCFSTSMNTGWAYFNYWYYWTNFYNYYNCYCGWSGNMIISNGNTFTISALEVWYRV